MNYYRGRSALTDYGLWTAGVTGLIGFVVLLLWGTLRNAKGVKLLPNDPEPAPLVWPEPVAGWIDGLGAIGATLIIVAVTALGLVAMNEYDRRRRY